MSEPAKKPAESGSKRRGGFPTPKVTACGEHASCDIPVERPRKRGIEQLLRSLVGHLGEREMHGLRLSVCRSPPRPTRTDWISGS